LMRPYFFYVGQLSRRKNLVRMFEAFADVDPAFDMVIAGPRSPGVDEIEAAHRRLRLGERVHLLGPVSESDLAALYVGALCHVLLSLDEGFGLPVLEAFQAGTPVLASDRGAIPEVAGDAALLVNPEDVPVIRDAMQRLAEDVNLCARLIRKGKTRVRAFGWRRSAEQTLALYRHVAGDHAMGPMRKEPGHPAPGDPVAHSGP
jgi:glycosyltransferase involved in cell wall biosynthesis